MKIALLGTRGIPNKHGGFEQFAEYFSVFLSNKGHDVYVYSSHSHEYQEQKFNNVNIIHCFDPENKIGTVGQFIYDLNCILDSRKRSFDVILQLGYTSSSIWHRLLPKNTVIATNMDGLEWKRTKYSRPVRQFLKYAEKLAAKNSDHLISDSLGIKDYLKSKYQKESEFIAYGAEVFDSPNDHVLCTYKVERYKYSMIIARLEPENNIETILDGYQESNTYYPVLIFGKINDYGKRLKLKYLNDKRIRFVGANYNIDNLNNLRWFSRYYFHGHSVGGTNPSLLEAMASSALIIANDNVFNKSILANDAFYFKDKNDILNLINNNDFFQLKDELCERNRKKILDKYSWNIINNKYEFFLQKLLDSNS